MKNKNHFPDLNLPCALNVQVCITTTRDILLKEQIIHRQFLTSV